MGLSHIHRSLFKSYAQFAIIKQQNICIGEEDEHNVDSHVRCSNSNMLHDGSLGSIEGQIASKNEFLSKLERLVGRCESICIVCDDVFH